MWYKMFSLFFLVGGMEVIKTMIGAPFHMVMCIAMWKEMVLRTYCYQTIGQFINLQVTKQKLEPFNYDTKILTNCKNEEKDWSDAHIL